MKSTKIICNLFESWPIMTMYDHPFWPMGQDCFVLAGPLSAALSSCHSHAEKRLRSSPMVYIQMVHKLSFIQNCEWHVKMGVYCIYMYIYRDVTETKKISLVSPRRQDHVPLNQWKWENIWKKKNAIWLKYVKGIPISAISKTDMGVSKNKGTPKWMVYNGKPY